MEENNHYMVQVSPQSGAITRIELGGRKPIVKDGESVKSGATLVKKSGNNAAIKAPNDGVVELVNDAIILVSAAGAPVKIEIPGDAELDHWFFELTRSFEI